MRKWFFYSMCFLCICCVHVNAQTNSAITPDSSALFKHNHLLFFSHNLNLTQTKPTVSVLHVFRRVSASEIKSGTINDMPFFCAMECRLRGRTGLWIKFRTGDDASYEKLIHNGKK